MWCTLVVGGLWTEYFTYGALAQRSDDKHVLLIKLLEQNSCQYGAIVWHEIAVSPRVSFLHNFKYSLDVEVV